MSKKVVIYTGPSLSQKEASKILDANYKNPVRRGDILVDIEDDVDIIGIIDGVFHHYPAVAHREIIKAMEKGIIVVGGGSMGALRASELDELGMIGIGYVYEQYKTGKITSDDDVSIVFSPEDNELLSEALVNIDFNMKIAKDKGIISQKEMEEILKTGKEIFYPKRTFKSVLDKSNIPQENKIKINEFLKEEYTDIKKEDAIALVKYIKNLLE